jgi:DNA-binding NtrC family response regulator
MPGALSSRASVFPPGLPDDPASPERVVTVLAVSPFEEDHVYLTHLFSHSRWQIYRARSWAEALGVLRRHRVPVVLCDSDMPEGGWKEVLAGLGQLSECPLLIVASRGADDNLWSEVLNLGGYDVLMKPFDHQEVVRVISLAWLHWKQQREHAGCFPEHAQATG